MKNEREREKIERERDVERAKIKRGVQKSVFKKI